MTRGNQARGAEARIAAKGRSCTRTQARTVKPSAGQRENKEALVSGGVLSALFDLGSARLTSSALLRLGTVLLPATIARAQIKTLPPLPTGLARTARAAQTRVLFRRVVECRTPRPPVFVSTT